MHKNSNTLFISCPKCQRKIRRFAKDFSQIKSRICPECGMKILLTAVSADMDQLMANQLECTDSPGENQAPAKITIVDDERGVREALGIYSEMLGCRPVLISDLSSFMDFHPDNNSTTRNSADDDILVVDQDLPGTTGLDFIQRLQEQGCQIPNYRKAVLSAALTNEEFRRAKKMGCHVLQKPVTYEIFENWLDVIKTER